MFRFLQILLYLPIRIFYPTNFHNKKNLPKGRAVLIVNHLSDMDCPLLAVGLFKEKKYYLAKKELFESKIGRWFFRSIGAIPVDRFNPDLKSIKECLGLLKKNKKLVVFPEGTRNKTNSDLLEIKGGAAVFAIKGKCPVVPIWIKKKPKLFRMNHVYIGKPFSLEEYSGQKLTEEKMNEISNLLKEMLLELKQ